MSSLTPPTSNTNTRLRQADLPDRPVPPQTSALPGKPKGLKRPPSVTELKREISGDKRGRLDDAGSRQVEREEGEGDQDVEEREGSKGIEEGEVSEEDLGAALLDAMGRSDQQELLENKLRVKYLRSRAIDCPESVGCHKAFHLLVQDVERDKKATAEQQRTLTGALSEAQAALATERADAEIARTDARRESSEKAVLQARIVKEQKSRKTEAERANTFQRELSSANARALRLEREVLLERQARIAANQKHAAVVEHMADAHRFAQRTVEDTNGRGGPSRRG
ncbi:hypothetical protein PENSPDRAFT_759686 [Peniophora sp. CONT]|nr:hypothetical protein PENSPDRAFT_759686 [Peniophora sp. CONT]